MDAPPSTPVSCQKGVEIMISHPNPSKFIPDVNQGPMPSGTPSKTQRPSLRSTVHRSCAFTEVKLGLASEYVKYSFLTKMFLLFLGKVLVGTFLVPFLTPSKNTPVVETVMPKYQERLPTRVLLSKRKGQVPGSASSLFSLSLRVLPRGIPVG